MDSREHAQSQVPSATGLKSNKQQVPDVGHDATQMNLKLRGIFSIRNR